MDMVMLIQEANVSLKRTAETGGGLYTDLNIHYLYYRNHKQAVLRCGLHMLMYARYVAFLLYEHVHTAVEPHLSLINCSL